MLLIVFSPAVSGAPTGELDLQGVDFQLFPLNNPGLVSIPLSFLLGDLGTFWAPGHAGATRRYAEMEVRSLTGAGAEQATSRPEVACGVGRPMDGGRPRAGTGHLPGPSGPAQRTGTGGPRGRMGACTRSDRRGRRGARRRVAARRPRVRRVDGRGRPGRPPPADVRAGRAAGEIPVTDPLYVVCRSGGRSARVVAYLAGQGYPAVNVDGGMQAWSAQGRDVVADSGAPQIV